MKSAAMWWRARSSASATIDILINNAGHRPLLAVLERAHGRGAQPDRAEFLRAARLAQLVVPHMRERKRGMIVNVGSIAGKVTLPWLTLYGVEVRSGLADRRPAHGTASLGASAP